ncbi:MAG TPA: hypothetical protein VHG27_10535 [Xanthobacteraceae bacterium]|nr:hypothetical protein [Xanthobacteraceae bacterium]
MTLHRQVAIALIASTFVALAIGSAAAQSGGSFDLNRPAAPSDSGCWTADACGHYNSYGRGA